MGVHTVDKQLYTLWIRHHFILRLSLYTFILQPFYHHMPSRLNLHPPHASIQPPSQLYYPFYSQVHSVTLSLSYSPPSSSYSYPTPFHKVSRLLLQTHAMPPGRFVLWCVVVCLVQYVTGGTACVYYASYYLNLKDPLNFFYNGKSTI